MTRCPTCHRRYKSPTVARWCCFEFYCPVGLGIRCRVGSRIDRRLAEFNQRVSEAATVRARQVLEWSNRGMSTVQIAQLLDRSTSAVGKLLKRARQRVVCLPKWGLPPGETRLPWRPTPVRKLIPQSVEVIPRDPPPVVVLEHWCTWCGDSTRESGYCGAKCTREHAREIKITELREALKDLRAH